MSLVYELVLEKSAIKFMKKQGENKRIRIFNALQVLREVPLKGDIRKLKGESGMYRLRIGTLRAVFWIDYNNKQVIVESIGNRGDIYK